MDHIVYSSQLAGCKNQVPFSFDINDDATEKDIQFMEPCYNDNVSSIEHDDNMKQYSICHDTFF